MSDRVPRVDAARYEASWKQCKAQAEYPPDPVPMPKVANVVTTWRMFPESEERKKHRHLRRKKRSRTTKTDARIDDYTLDLRSFARYNPATKLNTSNFSAAICRGCDQTTALLFASGTGVSVFSRSPCNGIYACRVYTHLIERTPMLVMPEGVSTKRWTLASGKLPAEPMVTTLEGRLLFEDVFRENIVAYGFLGCRISLERIYAVYPERVKYNPGNFPGLEWRAIVLDPTTKEEKMVKNLIFETGMWLIIGAQDISIANEVYWRLLKIAQEFKADTNARRDNERHQARLHRLWTRLYEPLIRTGNPDDVAKILPYGVAKTREQMEKEVNEKIRADNEARSRAEQVKRQRQRRKKKYRVTAEEEAEEEHRKRKAADEQCAREEAEGWSPLMIAAHRGNVGNVQMLLDMGEDPAFVNKVGQGILDVIKDKEGDVYAEVHRIVLRHMIPTELHPEVYPLGSDDN